jgi:hypothetical protein
VVGEKFDNSWWNQDCIERGAGMQESGGWQRRINSRGRWSGREGAFVRSELRKSDMVGKLREGARSRRRYAER